MTQSDIVSVLLTIPTEGAYSYLVPADMTLAVGDYVLVPLGSREMVGVVWDAPRTVINNAKLRSVIARFECPPMLESMRRFVEWVANYTLSPSGMILKMVLFAPAISTPELPRPGLKFSGQKPDRITPARAQVMEFSEHRLFWTKSELCRMAGVSSAVIDGLIKLQVLVPVDLPPAVLQSEPDPEFSSISLTQDQKQVCKSLVASINSEVPGTILLEGVTGSGKTEVYFEAISEKIRQGKQVLVLIPEIALTSMFLKRFENRFGAKPAEWHSELSPRRREKTWRQVSEGKLQVVAGARSSLFLPFHDLGLIIVDEEHDQAYKQEERIFYNARDMAVVRGRICQCPVILCSATPSLESRVNAQLERYVYLKLESRYGDARLPDLHTVDLRKHAPPRGRFLSPVLTDAIGEVLGRNEQSLLFLNRRGYAPLTLCRVCGYRFECNNCSTWLVEHRFKQILQCHHCGYSQPIPQTCTNCGALDHLVACGPGVERLAEEIINLFPDARIIVLSSDMAGGVKRMRIELDAIAKGEADIIIGTQLVAKGHHFPQMTLVGVVDADIGLASGDMRAAERTFQLLHQVTGRAGRSGGKSRGILQSYHPEHPVISTIVSGDKERFYERETENRRSASLPPFGRLASIIVSGKDRHETGQYAQTLLHSCPQSDKVRVLGPAEAPLVMIRGRYRFRLLVHAPRNFNLQPWLRNWFKTATKLRGNIRMQIDIDPQSFL